MNRLLFVVIALLAMSAEAIARLDAMGGSPPGCC